MAGITQNGQRRLISMWSPSSENNKKYLVLLMKKVVVIKTMVVVIMQNSDNYKDNISDNDNNSKMKVI